MFSTSIIYWKNWTRKYFKWVEYFILFEALFMINMFLIFSSTVWYSPVWIFFLGNVFSLKLNNVLYLSYSQTLCNNVRLLKKFLVSQICIMDVWHCPLLYFYVFMLLPPRLKLFYWVNYKIGFYPLHRMLFWSLVLCQFSPCYYPLDVKNWCVK